MKVVNILRSAGALARTRWWNHNRGDDVLRGLPHWWRKKSIAGTARCATLVGLSVLVAALCLQPSLAVAVKDVPYGEDGSPPDNEAQADTDAFNDAILEGNVEDLGVWYHVKFCGWYRLSFADDMASLPTGSAPYDYWTTNNDQRARGAKIKLIRNSDRAVVHEAFTPWTGNDIGCTPSLTLNSAESYEVRIYSTASVNDNTITVKKDDVNKAVYYSVARSAFTPTASSTIDVYTGTHAAWNIAGAAGWAMSRRNGGLNGETFVLYDQACPGGTSNCLSGGNNYIVTNTSKFVIVHELGHTLVYKANGGVSANSSTGLTNSTCPNVGGTHDFNSLEWQSGAAHEGFASYYAAVAWNKTQESNCTYVLHHWNDWNLDGVDNDTRVFSCEGAVPGESDAEDYAGQFCGAASNQGSQLDWMRFFWDLDNKEGLNTTDIVDLWVASSPDTWTATGVGSGAGFPSFELEAAADRLGFGTAWNNQESNGSLR